MKVCSDSRPSLRFSLLLLQALAACSGPGTSPDSHGPPNSGGADASTAPSGNGSASSTSPAPPSGTTALSLTASAPVSLANEAAGGTSPLFTVAATLENQSIASALPTAPAYFTLELTNHLVLSASAGVGFGTPTQGAVVTPCSGAVSVAAGGAATCNLVFSIPAGTTAAALRYADAAGHTATASVSPSPTWPTGTLECEDAGACSAATQDCCVLFTDSPSGSSWTFACVARGTCTQSGTAAESCESAANCGPAMVCCYSNDGGAGQQSCASTACAPHAQSCATSSECVVGSCVQGVCQ